MSDQSSDDEKWLKEHRSISVSFDTIPVGRAEHLADYEIRLDFVGVESIHALINPDKPLIGLRDLLKERAERPVVIMAGAALHNALLLRLRYVIDNMEEERRGRKENWKSVFGDRPMPQ